MKSLVFLLLLFAEAIKAQNILIKDITIIDVRNGKLLRHNDVFVQNNKITAIGKHLKATSDARIVNASNKFLIPGLWDMHSHILNRWDRAAILYVANGITGVRDMGTRVSLAEVKKIKADVLQGKLLGPRFITPGPLLDGLVSRFGDIAVLISSEQQALKVADSLKAADADFYKPYNALPREAFYAIIKKAKEYGLPVGGHVPFSVSRKDASNAGMKSFEHITWVDSKDTTITSSILNLFSGARRALTNGDTATADANLRKAMTIRFQAFDEGTVLEEGRLYANNGTWMTPTMVQGLKSLLKKEELLSDSNWSYMPATIVADWRRRLLEPRVMNPNETPEYMKITLKTISAFHKAGVRFLAGTDANDVFVGNIPGFSVHDEMSLFVKAGFSNLEAIQTATLNPSVYLGTTDSLGTIEKNNIADLILLDENPLENIANTKKIHAVILNGRYLDRKELDKILADARTFVSMK